MSFLYRKRFQTPLNPLLESLRDVRFAFSLFPSLASLITVKCSNT